MTSGLVSVDLVGAYRVRDRVVLFLNDERGWAFFEALCDLPPQRARKAVEAMLAAVKDEENPNYRSDGSMPSVLLLPMSKTALPPDFPEYARVGIKNERTEERMDFGQSQEYVPGEPR